MCDPQKIRISRIPQSSGSHVSSGVNICEGEDKDTYLPDVCSVEFAEGLKADARGGCDDVGDPVCRSAQKPGVLLPANCLDQCKQCKWTKQGHSMRVL